MRSETMPWKRRPEVTMVTNYWNPFISTKSLLPWKQNPLVTNAAGYSNFHSSHYSPVAMAPAKQEQRDLQIFQPASQHLKHASLQSGGTSVQHIIQIKPDNKSPLSTDCNRNTGSRNVQYFLSSRARTSRKLCRLFPCEFCGKMFTTSSGLYFHKPIHTGQWKYRCELCDKCYMETSKYRNHIMAHRKEILVGLNRK